MVMLLWLRVIVWQFHIFRCCVGGQKEDSTFTDFFTAGPILVKRGCDFLRTWYLECG